VPIVTAAQELADALSQLGMERVGGYFSQGDEDKTAFMQPRMGDDKPFFCHNALIVEKNVEVHGTGGVCNAPPTLEYIVLDSLEFSEELSGSQVGFKPERGIDEFVGRVGIDRFGVIEAGEGGDL
jgi:hypothetical protein